MYQHSLTGYHLKELISFIILFNKIHYLQFTITDVSTLTRGNCSKIIQILR